MIHKVKYGLMEVVLASSMSPERTPDLIFMGARHREFAVFFAPLSTVEGEAMQAASYDYCAPFEAEVLRVEEELDAAAYVRPKAQLQSERSSTYYQANS